MADRVGQQLGNYRLISLLGRGGFADVYLGEHQRLNTQAAIKVLHTQLTEDDEQGFLQEARIIAHLEHPHIVRVLDFDVVEGVPYLVMQYAPNGNLRQLHPKGSVLPLETILSYVTQITNALQYAHDQRLIHRDIKPENMLLGRNQDIILSDFGIALIAQSSHLQSTQDLIGTIAYMAPEQLQGKPRFASDQYALGIVVYEWLCGSRPFSGNVIELFSQHMFVPPPSLHEKMSGISPEVEQVMLKALAKEADQRFASVKAFAYALEQASQPKPHLLTATPLPIVLALPSVFLENKSNVNSAIDEVDEKDVYQNGQTTIKKNVDDREADSEEGDLLELSHIHNINPRTNSPENMPMPPVPLEIEDADEDKEEDDLPPIYDHSTRTIPFPSTANQAGAPAYTGPMGTREPQPLPLSPQRPPVFKTIRPALKKRPETSTRRKVTSPRVTGKIPLSARQQQSKQRKKKRNNSPLIPILVVVLVLLLIGLVTLLVPSADVTLTLPSHEYSMQMSLTANATSQQNTTLKTMLAHVLSFDTSVTGTGRATGTTKVGTIQADGTVIFTNTSTTSQVIIPVGTIVTTKDGIQFVISAEALANPGDLIPTPVKAQEPGVSGNVAAGSITVIPPASITYIQQANPTGTVVNLSVTNTDPTAHGGDGNATSPSSNDVATETSALDIQLQAKAKDFLAKNVLPGDQIGKTVQVETPTVSPSVGSVVNNGTFTETPHLHMTVLVVRAADLQTAAAAQLQDTLAQAKTGLDLVPQQPVQLKQVKNTSPSNGSSVKLSFTAVGQVAPSISEDTVRNLVSGKSVDDAQQALVGPNGIRNAIRTQITVNPSFFHFVPFWTRRINVHFLAVPQPFTSYKQ